MTSRKQNIGDYRGHAKGWLWIMFFCASHEGLL